MQSHIGVKLFAFAGATLAPIFLCAPTWGQVPDAGAGVSTGLCITPTNLGGDGKAHPCTAAPAATPSTNPMNQAAMNAAGQIGFALGEAIGQALFGDKTTDAAAAAAAAEAEREREEEAEKEAALAKKKQQEMYDRLSRALKLSGLATLSLKGFDNDYNSGLQLKGFSNAPAEPGGNLQLKGLGNSQPSTAPQTADGSQLVTHPFGSGGNPCPSSTVDSNFVDLRADAPGVCPGAPTGDPKVVDLRDVQQGVNLAVVAANATPADRDVILDQALDAANGNQSIQVNMAPSSTAPAVNEDGLRAFQQANAAYRQARESAYQHEVAYNEAEKKREMAVAIIGSYQAQLANDLQNNIDAMTLAQKQETMAKIFDAAVQERIAYGKTWAEYLAASAQYKFDKLAAEDELMRLAQTGPYDPNAPPPAPTKADLDLLLPDIGATRAPTKADLDLLLGIELSNKSAERPGELPVDFPSDNRLHSNELQEFPPALVHQYKSDPAFQQTMNSQHEAIFEDRDRAEKAVLANTTSAWNHKIAQLEQTGTVQPGVSITAQEQANPQLHAQLQQIRTQLESDAHYQLAHIDWHANDKWQAWIEAQNARLTGKPTPIYVPGP